MAGQSQNGRLAKKNVAAAELRYKLFSQDAD
jgi:hypothetical protein